MGQKKNYSIETLKERDGKMTGGFIPLNDNEMGNTFGGSLFGNKGNSECKENQSCKNNEICEKNTKCSGNTKCFNNNKNRPIKNDNWGDD